MATLLIVLGPEDAQLAHNTDAYFEWNPHLFGLTVTGTRHVGPAHFAAMLQELIDQHTETEFLVAIHGNPSGLILPLNAGTQSSADTDALFRIMLVRSLRHDADLADKKGISKSERVRRWHNIARTAGDTSRFHDPHATDEQKIEFAREVMRRFIQQQTDHLGLTDPGMSRLIDLIDRVHEREPRIARFVMVVCRIAEDPAGVVLLREVLNAQDVGAPDVRTRFGAVHFAINAGGVAAVVNSGGNGLVVHPRGAAGHAATLAFRINHADQISDAACTSRRALHDFVEERFDAAPNRTGWRRLFARVHWLRTEPPVLPLDPAYRRHFFFSRDLQLP